MCAKCNGPDPDDCEKCASSSFFLYNGECFGRCPQGSFDMSGDKYCQECDSTCKSCHSFKTCDECKDGLVKNSQGHCVSYKECDIHEYKDEHKGCLPCHRKCSRCAGASEHQCLSCKDSYYLLKCDSTCKSCHSFKTCDECKDGLVKNSQGHCVSYKECDIHEYKDEHKGCLPCHRKCSRCAGASEHQCLSCKDSYYLLNSTCVSKCPDGHYQEDEEKRCVPCHSTCKTCSGRRSSQCLSCKEEWYSLGHSCVQHCISGYYADNTTASCERCHRVCKECQGPDSNDCLACFDKFFLMKTKNQCYSSCPEYYFEDHAQKACERCHPTCRMCRGSGALSCTSCVSSYQLQGGICISECFAGEYKGTQGPDGECEKCHESCIECKGRGPLNCTVCPASFLLYVNDGRCVQCCHSKPEDSRECCDCSEIPEECKLITELLVDNDGHKKTALFVATSILVVLSIGAIIFFWRRARAKASTVIKGGYEKLPDQTKSFQSFKSNRESTSSFQRDHVIEYHDREEEEDDDDDDEDIVYMGQDGTVYRKFKYGLLEDDDDEDLEYDDESYSFR
ncbi:PREDICTED: proprotein convertase subtilisin/kexin type 5-like [Nanorana parkeri]|uniref:proprotein convertase subtilisin/kexin type 5-like n=1 Tax=Nanorana parkeri TaxID=125878 RepID=UPI0008541E83|nr:PREDICTED: proprotein convertase subtilisin/kexin type 5-like [Nanorana parkeri]